MSPTIKFALCLTLALPLLAVPAAAQHERRVSFADLDLDNPRDRARLAARLDDAARSACGGSPRFGQDYRLAPAAERARFETCRADAAKRALAALENARARHASRDANTPSADGG